MYTVKIKQNFSKVQPDMDTECFLILIEYKDSNLQLNQRKKSCNKKKFPERFSELVVGGISHTANFDSDTQRLMSLESEYVFSSRSRIQSFRIVGFKAVNFIMRNFTHAIFRLFCYFAGSNNVTLQRSVKTEMIL